MAESVFVELLRSLPRTLRVIAISVVLSVVVIAAIGIVVLVVTGRGFEIWQIKINAYQSPQVQLCSNLVEAVDKTNGTNNDVTGLLNAQVMQLQSMVAADQARANEINDAGGHSVVADKYRAEASVFMEQASKLRDKINEIIQNRLATNLELQTACGKTGG